MLVALGCGGNGASNNDQGMSVTFLGLFSSLPDADANTGQNLATAGQGGCAQLPPAITGGYLSLSQVTIDPNETPVPGFIPLAVDPSGAVSAIVGVQNNLYGQFFRADRALLQYYVAGASIQPPSTNVAVNFLAGPAESGTQLNQNGGAGTGTGGTGTGGTGTTGGTSGTGRGLRQPIVTSLPPSFSQVCNRSFAQIPVIPSPIREWLNFNRTQLPPPPYNLEVVVQLSGLSSSGNRYDTNTGVFSFNIIPETRLDPTGEGGAVDTPTTDPTATPSTTVDTLSYEGDEIDTSAQGLEELEKALESQSSVSGEIGALE
jgi:hypothetical protein